MVLPLQRIKVVDLSEEIAGPYCSMQLGDGGADVIKVEPLAGDWARSLGPRINGESALYLALNRNKRSIAVDIGEVRGKEVIYQLAKEADVLLESFSPGQADSFGLGYEDICCVNPNVIYCSISALGSSGPYKDRAASELEVQGMSGYLWFLGEPGEAPVRVGADVAAVTAGMFAFIGILVALYYRKKTGVGQKVETSMLGALLATGSGWIAAHYNPDFWGGWFVTGPFDHAEGGYKTKDRPLMFGMPLSPVKQKEAWANFCRKVGLGDLLKDPFFQEKGARMLGIGRDAQEWKPVIEAAFENRTAEELREIIESVHGQVGIFKTYEEIFNEPQVSAVEMVREIEHPVVGKIKVTGIPWKLSGTPAKIKSPPPTLGQHTDEILLRLGYSKEEIADLRQTNVVA